MEEGPKKILVICIAVLAVGAAVYFGTKSVAGPKEEVIGTLPSPEGGLRDAEKGGSTTTTTDPVTGEEVADVASGMPADMVNPGN